MLEKQTLLGIFDITPRESMWRKIDEQKEAINGLRYTKDENCKQIDALNLKLATAEQAKKDLVRRLDALQGDVAKLEYVNARLQKKIDEQEKVKATLNRQINELRDENARLKEENARLQEQIDELEKQRVYRGKDGKFVKRVKE